jgi:hypothetical protein
MNMAAPRVKQIPRVFAGKVSGAPAAIDDPKGNKYSGEGYG